jgi:hypothetical protein
MKADYFYRSPRKAVKSICLELPETNDLRTLLAAAFGLIRTRDLFEIQTDKGIWSIDGEKTWGAAPDKATFKTWEQLETEEIYEDDRADLLAEVAESYTLLS